MNKPATAIKAIRAYCLGCAAGSTKTVRDCAITDCPLHFYRLGKNPGRPALSDDEKEERIARLRKSTETK